MRRVGFLMMSLLLRCCLCAPQTRRRKIQTKSAIGMSARASISIPWKKRSRSASNWPSKWNGRPRSSTIR